MVRCLLILITRRLWIASMLVGWLNSTSKALILCGRGVGSWKGYTGHSTTSSGSTFGLTLIWIISSRKNLITGRFMSVLWILTNLFFDVIALDSKKHRDLINPLVLWWRRIGKKIVISLLIWWFSPQFFWSGVKLLLVLFIIVKIHWLNVLVEFKKV